MNTTSDTMHTGLRDIDVTVDNPKFGQPAELTRIKVKNEHHSGLGIYIHDHSTNCAADDYQDAVVYLEIQDGKPILRVWADINQEEPTHTIDLSGAHINRRLTRFKGNLYFMDEKGVKNHIADFEETGATASEMEKKVLDQLWDSRLDSASCAPHFEYEIVG